MEFLAWPAVALIVSVFFLLLFKRPLSKFIDRTERISKEGVHARAPQEQPSESTISRVDEFLSIYDNQLLLEAEKLIRVNLDNLKPKNAEERERFLVRNLAAVSVTDDLLRTYFPIYGSQIITLQYLNDNRSAKLTIDHIRPFYSDAKVKHPSYYQNYNFDGWLNFLVTTNLVQRNGDNVGITVRGKEFLKVLLEQGLSFLKAG